MSLRDYYEILQLSRDATPEQVKTAYRAMARKYHPDQNPDPSAVERFKQVAEAYRVLSNPETRLAYDRWGHTPAGSAFAPTTMRRADNPVVSALRSAARSAGRALKAQRGKDIHLRVSLPFLDAALGCIRVFELPRKSTRDPDGLNPVPRRLEFRLQAGVAAGETLRWPGEGEPGTYGAPDGALLVTVDILPHPVFSRRGNDVVAALPVPLSQLIAGATLEVPTLHGLRPLRIPAGTPTGTELRIVGDGIRRDGVAAGDAVFVMGALVPRQLDPELLAQLRQVEGSIGLHATPERIALERLVRDLRSES
jgi:curved DNA-binding protein